MALKPSLSLCLLCLGALASTLTAQAAEPLLAPGIGHSQLADPAQAGEQAAQAAKTALGATAPKIVLVFAARKQLTPGLIDGIAKTFPKELIYGCEGYSPLALGNNFVDQGHSATNAVAVLALGGTVNITPASAATPTTADKAARYEAAGTALGEQLKEAMTVSQSGKLLLTFGDQHVGDNVGLVKGLAKVLGANTSVVGAAAGGGGAKEIVKGQIVTATNVGIAITGPFTVGLGTQGGKELVNVAATAMTRAIGQSKSPAALVLVFDCGGRRGEMVKQKCLGEELQAMQKVAGSAPLFGFYGGGEIGPTDSKCAFGGVGLSVATAAIFPNP